MTIVRSVTNASSTTAITLPIPGFDANKAAVTIAGSGTLDLFTVLTDDQLEAIQPLLVALIADGSITSAATVDPTTFSPVGAASTITTSLSAATAGGAATQVVTVAGLLTTSRILAVSQSVKGANNLPLLSYTNSLNGSLSLIYSADPGAGAKATVSFI